MSLVLSRVDYASVGVTSIGTTKILPRIDSKSTQKFAVGDHDGIIYIYGVKKNELQLIFKSLPGDKIVGVTLGGSIGTPKDKIFIAYGNSVKGFTKKGKMFLEFDTSLIDPINAMFVLGPDLAVCARDLYHRYQNCKDADSYLVGEIIHDIVLIMNDGNSIVAVLACGDCAIRLLCGTNKPTILRLPSVPMLLKLYREGDNESLDRILVGTLDGKIGLLILQGNRTIRVVWLINDVGSEITSLDSYELDDGIDIIVGRQDGNVEVFRFPLDDELTIPSLRYRYNAGESISSVVGGNISSIDYPEILVTTYSGRIFGLTTKSQGLLAVDADDLALNRLKIEIHELEMKLNDAVNDIGCNFNNSFIPLGLSVNYRMHLDKVTASYLLLIELDTPIDNVLIQCDAPIELLHESNNAVLSLSMCNPHDDNFILATYRCQINTNHLEIRFRTIEGQSGTLKIYVTTQLQPKCCRKIKIPIYALSMHVRLHDNDDDNNIDELPCNYNELKLNGNFTVAEMHAWLCLALADIPQRPNLQDNEVTLNYVSTVVGTVLKCKYKKGSGLFIGENISTIIILRDLLTKEATKRKIKLDVFCNANDGSVKRILELIHPRLEIIHELNVKLKILDALKELEMKDDTSINLCSMYQDLLKHEELIRKQIADDPDNLQRLYGVVIDLYVDWKRAKGALRMTSQIAAEELNLALESRNLTLINQVFFGLEEN